MLFKFQYKAPQDLECIEQGYVGDAAQICSNFSFLCHSRKTLRPFGLSCSDFWPGVERAQRGSALSTGVDLYSCKMLFSASPLLQDHGQSLGCFANFSQPMLLRPFNLNIMWGRESSYFVLVVNWRV